MPWTAQEFKNKHNKKLSPVQAAKAAKIANSVLKRTGNEASAIKIANAAGRRVMGKSKG